MGADQFEKTVWQDRNIFRYVFLCIFVVGYKFKARKKYKTAVVDDATLDDILLLYVKGEQIG